MFLAKIMEMDAMALIHQVFLDCLGEAMVETLRIRMGKDEGKIRHSFSMGVSFAESRFQAFRGNVGINLRSGKRGMSKHFFYGYQVGPIVQQVCREGMA
jgi:hypothetical protein